MTSIHSSSVYGKIVRLVTGPGRGRRIDFAVTAGRDVDGEDVKDLLIVSVDAIDG
jgi:hypothetical protein